jgi:hypothetical protein
MLPFQGGIYKAFGNISTQDEAKQNAGSKPYRTPRKIFTIYDLRFTIK